MVAGPGSRLAPTARRSAVPVSERTGPPPGSPHSRFPLLAPHGAAGGTDSCSTRKGVPAERQGAVALRHPEHSFQEEPCHALLVGSNRTPPETDGGDKQGCRLAGNAAVCNAGCDGHSQGPGLISLLLEPRKDNESPSAADQWLTLTEWHHTPRPSKVRRTRLLSDGQRRTG